MTSTQQMSDVGILCLQIHLELAPELNEEELRSFLSEFSCGDFGGRLSFQISQEDGAHIDAGFESPHVEFLWQAIEPRLFNHPVFGESMSKSCIALRTGLAGFDDYALLYHYDSESEQAG